VTSATEAEAALGPPLPASSQRPSGGSVAVWPMVVDGGAGTSCPASAGGSGV
jgi:hypothetical protein